MDKLGQMARQLVRCRPQAFVPVGTIAFFGRQRPDPFGLLDGVGERRRGPLASRGGAIKNVSRPQLGLMVTLRRVALRLGPRL